MNIVSFCIRLFKKVLKTNLLSNKSSRESFFSSKKMYKIVFNFLSDKKFDRILILTIIVLGITLLTSQIGLLSKSTRTFFTNIEKYEGVDINNISEAKNKVTLKLELINTEPTDKIKVLINGYEAHQFKEKIIEIDVKNNSVIEIDGTRSELPFGVRILAVSDNILQHLVGKEVLIDSKIIILTRILFKESSY